MADQLSLEFLTSKLIGVVDLKAGQSVRAVAGKRNAYRATKHFQIPGGDPVAVDGDADRLVECYLAAGLQAIYVADLDAISNQQWQRSQIEAIADACGSSVRLLLDCGLSDRLVVDQWDWVASLANECPNVVAVVATETASIETTLTNVLNLISKRQVAVSFDYQDSVWRCPSNTQCDWIRSCKDQQIETVIGLDLASVGGTSAERTVELCDRLRASLPDCDYITGGGVRNEIDARRLISQGASGILVASWFTA